MLNQAFPSVPKTLSTRSFHADFLTAHNDYFSKFSANPFGEKMLVLAYKNPDATTKVADLGLQPISAKVSDSDSDDEENTLPTTSELTSASAPNDFLTLPVLVGYDGGDPEYGEAACRIWVSLSLLNC